MAKQVIVDDRHPSIQYAGDWRRLRFEGDPEFDQTRTFPLQNSSSAIFTFKGVNLSACLIHPPNNDSDAFEGSHIAVYGSIFQEDGGNGSMTFQLEEGEIGTYEVTARPGGQNNSRVHWLLWESNADEDVEHTLKMGAGVVGQARGSIQLDYLVYTPSQQSTTTSTQVLNDRDESIRYDPTGWTQNGCNGCVFRTATSVSAVGSAFHFTFTGE